MKKNNFKSVLLSLLSAWLLLGCAKDEVFPESEPKPPLLEITGIPADGFGFLYFEETTKTFIVESDSPWEMNKTDGWFIVTPSKGKAGSTEVKIHVIPNEDVERTGEFTLTANSGTLIKPTTVFQTFTVIQGGYLSAGLSLNGLASNNIIFDADSPTPLSFTLLAAYPWSINLNGSTWLSVSPSSGAGGQSVPVIITLQPNTQSVSRECTLTITTSDPENPFNSDMKEILIRQRAHFEWDTALATGTVLFSDDFNWITPLWQTANAKYGYPTVSSGVPEISGSNEYAFTTSPLSTEMANRGWTFNTAYARAEGWAKLGTASALGQLTSPAMTAIAAGKVANLLVSFDGALYASAGGTRDSNSFTVSVTGDGTINDTGGKSLIIPMQTHFGFDKYYFMVNNASASTKINLGSTGTATNTRFIVDNVKIVRVANFDVVIPDREPVVLPLDFEVRDLSEATAYHAGKVVEAGATLRYLIRVNHAWTATPSESWLKFIQVFSGTAANGGSVSGGNGSATATALSYNNCQITVEPNTTMAARTATITVTSEGTTVQTITITQEAGTPPADNIILTGITADKVELVAESPSMVLFKVNATSAWSLSAPDTWYTILPVSGAPNKDVEVVLVPQTNSGAARSGSFTITAGAATKIVTVEQAGVIADGLPASWMMPAKNFVDGVASDNSANLNVDEWWVKSDDGNSILRAKRYGDTSNAQKTMSYTTSNPADGDRLLLYGMVQNDYWQLEIPTTGIAAGSTLKIESEMQSSGTGPRDFLLQYSSDQTTWTSINPIIDGAVTYTVRMGNAVKTPIVKEFTVGNAIPSGTLYIRLLISGPTQASGTGNVGTGGTSRICRPLYTSEANKVPIMKVTKL